MYNLCVMGYLYLALSILFIASNSILSSFFTKKEEGSNKSHLVFNIFLTVSTMLCWLVAFLIDGTFNINTIWYSIGFGVGFIGTFVFLLFALKSGPLSLSSLILQLSLVLVAIYGFIFWNDKVTTFKLIGIGLVVVSLVLILIKFEKKSDSKPFNFKWLIFILLAMISNTACSICQKSELIRFENQYGNQTMFFALALASVISLVNYLISRKKVVVVNLKKHWWLPVVAGVFNFAGNIFVILLAKTTLPTSLIYPAISVGALIVTVGFSVIVYKEKLSFSQWCGMIIGATAIILLSI